MRHEGVSTRLEKQSTGWNEDPKNRFDVGEIWHYKLVARVTNLLNGAGIRLSTWKRIKIGVIYDSIYKTNAKKITDLERQNFKTVRTKYRKVS